MIRAIEFTANLVPDHIPVYGMLTKDKTRIICTTISLMEVLKYGINTINSKFTTTRSSMSTITSLVGLALTDLANER